MEVGEMRTKQGEVLASRLREWTDSGLISPGQADRILQFEQAEASRARRRIPLITEALAYVGAVLAITGGGVAIAQVWEDMSAGAHVALLGAGTGMAFLGGWLAKPSKEPAFQRLVDVLWLISVGGIVATFALLFAEYYNTADRDAALFTALFATAWSAMLYALRRHAIELIVLYGAVHASAIAAIVYPEGGNRSWAYASVVWGLGAIMAFLGWRGVAQPAAVGLPLGAFGMMVAPSLATGQYGWALGVGIVTAAGAMAFSVWTRYVPLLVFGSIAMFGYITATVVRYLGDQLGVPVALAVAGALILAMAVGVARLFKVAASGPPDAVDAEGSAEPPVRIAS